MTQPNRRHHADAPETWEDVPPTAGQPADPMRPGYPDTPGAAQGAPGRPAAPVGPGRSVGHPIDPGTAATAPDTYSQDTVRDAGDTTRRPHVRRSRFGGLWVGLIVAALILVVLLVFVLQNSQSVQIDFFGWSGHAPLAVAILLGGVAGALLVAIPGTVRILQLRKQVHKH